MFRWGSSRLVDRTTMWSIRTMQNEYAHHHVRRHQVASTLFILNPEQQKKNRKNLMKFHK